jgi:hypothetical protein
MLLRSGTIINEAGNVNVCAKNTMIESKYMTFKVKCMDFIEELKGAMFSINTIHILHQMYIYIDSEIDNVSSYLDLYPGLETLLNWMVNKIPKHIQDIIYYEKNAVMGATLYELTGFTAIEIAHTLYEVRLKIHTILDVYGIDFS